MGHNTIISRLFIKVDEKRFIPYVNTRVSNCTTISFSGREIKVQENFPLYMKTRNVATMQDIHDWVEETVKSKIECNQNYDWADKTDEAIRSNFIYNANFHLSGKSIMSDKQIINWFNSGFKNGYTIEELKEIYPSVTISMRNYDTKDVVFVTDTELLKILLDDEKYNSYQLSIDNYDYVLKRVQEKNRLKRNLVSTEVKPVTEYYYVESQGCYYSTRRRKVTYSYELKKAKKFKHMSQANIFLKRLSTRYGVKNAEVKKVSLEEPQLINF